MPFIAACLRREGRLLSKFQTERAWRRGELDVQEAFDKEAHRVVRVARFLEPDNPNPTDVFPPLHDVQLVCIRRGGWWTMTGYERVLTVTGMPSQPVSFQQSWALEPVDPRKRDRRAV